MHSITRRDFARLGLGAAAAVKAGLVSAQSLPVQVLAGGAAQDTGGRKIRFVSIGTGIRGCDLLRSARQVPTGECVGTADLYDMHQRAGIEAWGAEVPTTKDYRTLLDRKDVDAVIVAVADFQHRRVVLDCVAAGKDVYCEKPMSHTVADGLAMVAAVESGKRIFQAGSQRVSNVVYKKAGEIYAAGRLGEVHLIEARTDRNGPSGAWVYPVAPDASPATIDWKTWLRDAPERPFDAVRFFEWRRFKEYCEGMAGDLFVHLFSGTHFITGSHGPTRAMATGGLRFWKDGRDAPDVMLGLFDYKEGFNLSLRVNFVDGGEESEGLVFTGSEGTMEIGGDFVSVNRVPRETEPGLTIGTYSLAMQKKILEQYEAKYPRKHPQGAPPPGFEKYVAAEGYSDQFDHFSNFFASVRSRKPVVEDAVFGFRAAGAALLSNLSIEKDAICHWDPEIMKVV